MYSSRGTRHNCFDYIPRPVLIAIHERTSLDKVLCMYRGMTMLVSLLCTGVYTYIHVCTFTLYLQVLETPPTSTFTVFLL